MARMRRLVVPGQPHLIALLGNIPAIAVDDVDRHALLAALRTAASASRVAIHGYVVLRDRLYLLLTPPQADSTARMMQALGRYYVASFNARHNHKGTIWAGRYRGAVLEARSWLMPCLRFLESAPVAAGLAADAESYAWSSARHHLGLHADPIVSDHACYWALGNTPFEREAAYRDFLAQGVAADQGRSILYACLQGWALGSAAFIAHVEQGTARPVRPRARGRPRKSVSVPI
jgi:putative transposase